eukprot:4717802-Amphidinium_carterae.1
MGTDVSEASQGRRSMGPSCRPHYQTTQSLVQDASWSVVAIFRFLVACPADKEWVSCLPALMIGDDAWPWVEPAAPQHYFWCAPTAAAPLPGVPV